MSPGPTTDRWLVFQRATGKVDAWLCAPEEVPALIKMHTAAGSTIVKVARSKDDAIAARHDAQGRCGGCAGGKGRARCPACQERTLSERLRLSVAVASAQTALRKMVGQQRGARGARGEQR